MYLLIVTDQCVVTGPQGCLIIIINNNCLSIRTSDIGNFCVEADKIGPNNGNLTRTAAPAPGFLPFSFPSHRWSAHIIFPIPTIFCCKYLCKCHSIFPMQFSAAEHMALQCITLSVLHSLRCVSVYRIVTRPSDN